MQRAIQQSRVQPELIDVVFEMFRQLEDRERLRRIRIDALDDLKASTQLQPSLVQLRIQVRS